MKFIHREAPRFVRWVILLLYAAAIQWIAMRAGEPSNVWWCLLLVPILLWIIAPIAFPLLAWSKTWLVTLATGLIAAGSVYIYLIDMFGPGARSTSAIVFVFLPVYQWMAVAALYALHWLIARLRRSDAYPPHASR